LIRNNKIFSNEIPSINTTTHKAFVLFKSWTNSSPYQPRKKIKKRIHELEEFTIGWFDGATSFNGAQSGVGGLIKISKNSFYLWTFNCGPGTNTRA